MTPAEIALYGFAGVVSFMALLWVVSLWIGEADIVDFGWAASVGLLGVWYGVVGFGDPLTRFMVVLSSGVWGGRLAGYLLVKRVLKSGEDGRYATLRKSWGNSAKIKFLIFFQAQAVLAFVLSISFIITAFSNGTDHRVAQLIGLLIMVCSLTGESVADFQLSSFVSKPENKGEVCNVGLWKYSRHPNYFFEWLGWCSYPFIAAGFFGSWIWFLTLLSPVMILFLILKVTGIPPTEARSLESRGDKYKEYQRTTSAFIPWFYKRPLSYSLPATRIN